MKGWFLRRKTTEVLVKQPTSAQEVFDANVPITATDQELVIMDMVRKIVTPLTRASYFNRKRVIIKAMDMLGIEYTDLGKEAGGIVLAKERPEQKAFNQPMSGACFSGEHTKCLAKFTCFCSCHHSSQDAQQ